MTKYLSTAVAAGALVLGVSSASAAQVDGTVSFTALTPVTVDSTTLANVDTLTFTAGPNAFVAGGLATNGDFDAVEGDPAHFETFTVSAAAGNLLWTLGAGNLQFVMATASNDSPASNTALVISGTGTISGGGFDATDGTFAITAANAQLNNEVIFVFNAQSDAQPDPVSTPDGGATAMLLGLGVLGLGVVSRNRKA